MRKKFKERAKDSFTPLRPNLKWVVVGFSIFITAASIFYTNFLVDQIREREEKQIQVYARSLEFLATANSNFLMIFDEIVSANTTIPVVICDENGNPEEYKNLPHLDKLAEGEKKQELLLKEVASMKEQHDPIKVVLTLDQENVFGYKYIYYKNSFLLTQLQYYPYVQLTVIGAFGLITFLILNYLRKVEQNRVWVGLAKETAHQLGTPLSSLMAWSEYFKELYPDQNEILKELDKDIDRLKIITDRFSSIGSEPQLMEKNIPETVEEVVDYLSKRLSTKIQITISSFPNREIVTAINPSLFAWVIENLCKNAADAMEGKGAIEINILKVSQGEIAIDVADNGKGILKGNVKNVFKPGFTTKKRGWGLGLALAKRIIEQYHRGKIVVKQSEVNKGTTFRIYLNG